MNTQEKEILEKLVVFQPQNQKIRLGRGGDGGYVVIDGYGYDLFLSCGIGNEVSFDQDFSKYQPDVKGFAFDGTCSRPSDLPSQYNFIHKNIGPLYDDNNTNLWEYLGYDNIFLKMDIEGFEWTWIKSIGDLSKFKQIVLECHGFFDETCPTGSWSSIGKFVHTDVLESLEILNRTHYLVHLHGNNAAVVRYEDGTFGNSRGVGDLFTVAELTYIRKTDCDVVGLNYGELPISGLDRANYDFIPDIHINRWPFVSQKDQKIS